MRRTPSLSSLPGPLWPWVVAPDRVLSMSQIELNCTLMLNWIAWNGTVWHWNCVLLLNWFIWNRTVFMYKMNLALINYNGWCTIKPNQTKPNYLNMCKQLTNSKLNYTYKIAVLWTVAERKNFKLLFSAGIILAVDVSILYFRPMRMI